MYQMKEEDARKALDSLRQAKRSIEEGIMILERLVIESYVQNAEISGNAPDDYLYEWVTPDDDDEPGDRDLFEMYALPEDLAYKNCDCGCCEGCTPDEPETEEYYGRYEY